MKLPRPYDVAEELAAWLLIAVCVIGIALFVKAFL